MLNNKHGYLFLLFFYIISNFISAHPPHNFPNFYLNCLSRCVAKCFDESQRFTQNDQRLLPKALTECQTKCRLYGQPGLCGSNNDCWKRCKDLGPPEDQSDENKGHHPKLQAPNDVEMIYNENTTIDVSWHQTSAPNGEPTKIYLLQIETEVPNHQITQIFTSEHSIDGMAPASIESICGPISIKVASASAKHELSQWSKKVQLDSEGPQIAGKMELVHVKFNSTPFNFEDYIANATLDIELRFIMNSEWPMGIEDLEVAPLFHLVGCNTPNLEQPLPAPEFHRGTRDDTVQTIVGADLMYRRCKFAYAVEEVRSNRCGSSFHFSPGQNELQFFEMNCDTVAGSDCRRTTKSNLGAPLCGQFSDFNFTVIEEIINETAQTEHIAVNLTFTPNNRIMKMHPEYYVALFGNAKELRNIDRALMSQTVDMIDILGEQTNCADFSTNKSCKRIKNEKSIVLDGLVRNKLYGVLLCAVRDPNNLSYPVNETNKSFKPQVFRLFLQPRESVKNVSAEENAGKEREHYMLWIVGGSGILCAVLLLLIVTIFFAYCRQRDKNRKNQINMENMRRNRDQRYTDFPARNREDQWELERRKLIIYEDKRLGSGAFGSVYLGKLVGLQNGKQPLSIGLMRAENSLVAVKMLPEYADEVSKSEFLREIGLMKSLGFHERLVNMLACVTQSEPYCLVVEYCSDGDLLQFLRARCKYMLELNEAGVKYSEPNCETDFDRAMIMTVKQLLVFAVQISYGLEYLSQKGFVHRDVAARNILVQDKTYAKIGDFGLCRFIYADSDNYKSRGGRLPIKWMAPEAIRHYEFTTSSDVWSFGVLMFEIITLGGTPYPGMQPDDMLLFLESGKRMSQPDNCPDDYYRVMWSCWTGDPRLRLEFAQIRQQLALQLENVSDEYAYLKLDAKKDYYNVSYGELRALCGEVGKRSVEDQNDNVVLDKMEPENVA